MPDNGRPIFSKPAGASERIWNNQHMGTIAEIICQTCGTKHGKLSERDSSRIVDNFLGLEMVEECCGRAIDVLYEELGEDFCIAFLKDFAEDPTNPCFGFLKSLIPDIVEKAQGKCREAIEVAEKMKELAD